MAKVVCITWASSGIWKACAHQFSKSWYDCILISRREKHLKILWDELMHLYWNEIYIWSVDVQDARQVANFFLSLPQKVEFIDVLINGAWLALWIASLVDTGIEDINVMIDTNVKWLLYVTKYALPLLLKSTNGHIINIWSISAKSYYVGWTVYCASKAAVLAINECLRLELKWTNVFTTCIQPWLVDTDFQQVRFNSDDSYIQSFLATRLGDGKQLTASEVAEVIYGVIGKNISELTIWHK